MKLINEAKRMQELAGIVTEVETATYNPDYDGILVRLHNRPENGDLYFNIWLKYTNPDKKDFTIVEYDLDFDVEYNEIYFTEGKDIETGKPLSDADLEKINDDDRIHFRAYEELVKYHEESRY